MIVLGRGCQILVPPVPFFHEVGLEVVPSLVSGGLILLRHHLVLGEHLTFPHLHSCRHCLLLDACQDSVVVNGDLEPIKAGEVGRDVVL
jgi:hypothetical protein